jgi:drug/metabolite transporter (DMT)-like permease
LSPDDLGQGRQRQDLVDEAPVATVAALRETAILFAVVISVVFLKERVSAWRIIAACIIALGALLLRLA